MDCIDKSGPRCARARHIENWSLGFDLYIIMMTMFRLHGPQAY